jgi:hypothetical protein
LAWAAARRGDLVQASAWVLRGDRGEPRDPSLRWASGQVRDAGGLQGFAPVRVPVRSEEWGLLALLAALGSAWLARPWRWVVLAAAALVAMAPVIDVARASRVQRAIVAAPATLGGEGVDLAIGQVLRVLEIQGRRVRVTAGPDLAGVVDRGALIVEDRGW